MHWNREGDHFQGHNGGVYFARSLSVCEMVPRVSKNQIESQELPCLLLQHKGDDTLYKKHFNSY